MNKDTVSAEVSSPTPSSSEVTIKVYRRRWIILAIFSFISMSNEVIWISLSSIASIISGYYQVSYSSVNWLSMIFCLMYFSVVLSTLILHKYGLKIAIVMGALCNAVGSAFRFIGYKRNGFLYVCIGNAFGGLAQSFLISVPPTLAATWFGEKERGKASAIGMLMNFFGVAVGFLMGGMIVPHSSDYQGVVKEGLFSSLLSQTVFCCVLLILSVIFIEKTPPLPPSRSQVINNIRRASKESTKSFNSITKEKESASVETKMRSVEKDAGGTDDDSTHSCGVNFVMNGPSTGLLKNFKMLLSHLTFHLLVQGYAVYFGLFVSINGLLNQIVSEKYPGKEQAIGMMGAASVVFGLISIMLAGFWVDKTHRYKMLSIVLFASSFLSLLIFNVLLHYGNSFIAIFVIYCVYGFCSYPYMSTGLEYAAELMYPIKESILSYILLLFGMIYGIILTFIFGAIINKVGSNVAVYVAAGMYLLGLLCILPVKGELKRLRVDAQNTCDIIKQENQC